MSLERNTAKARAWQDRSRAAAAERQRTAPRKRVKPQSAKRQADAPIRRALVARMLAEAPICQARLQCRGAATTEVHERLSRARGGSITDERHGHMVALCHACHAWITTHPAEAERLRWALPSWHQCPPIGPC